ncbi:hypothetical protein ACFSTE_18975 [Aquimarina hainanensis]|uniref:Uncharacterized protein n=1 Tax=Aquimarina hainanensis TaxID=1578017 RepID=A0ABW5NFF3_9FLAO|nr:hypothetical protein [Aquimarina sp. TRL1]QKX06591.1 hypothetical protein HN014_17275 [Aquimarina sp. TRL1]
MILSALFYLVVGFILTFFSFDVASYMHLNASPLSIMMLNITGSLYLFLGVLNWMSKGNTIGGNYNQPLVWANILHPVITLIAMIRAVFMTKIHSRLVLILCLVYVLLGALFVHILLTNPMKPKKSIHHSK